MSPAAHHLETMTVHELRLVRGFRIGHHQFGFVEFNEPVDLSSFSDISKQVPGRLIVFGDRTFTLYPNEADRPAKGLGFNVSATVTLYNVFARSRETHEPVKDPKSPICSKFVQRLKSKANFISWDAYTGTFTFGVNPT